MWGWLFDDEAVVSEDELALLRGWKVASDAGVPDDAMTEIVRVYTRQP